MVTCQDIPVDEYRIRAFRNYDVPQVVSLWNRAMPEEHCARPLKAEAFERLILGKLYFDGDGLLLAECDGNVVGMVHGGVGPNDQQIDLDNRLGTIAILLVDPSHRRCGLGRRLLRAVEDYLRQRGATAVYGMGMWPVCPFYVGLYGGSEMPGLLSSDTAMRALLEHCGYEPAAGSVVMRRDMDEPTRISDRRFRLLRRRYQITVTGDITDQTWWWQQVYGCFEGERILLRDNETRQVVGSAFYWDMAEFARSGPGPAVGIIDVRVDQQYRRKGLGRYLMTQLLARLLGYYVSTVEIVTMETNQAAQNLYTGLGFKIVERGTTFRRSQPLG